ncbi:MAG: MFS transporter [Proteobacteria bacterium]|nr:MFS transporter [Pseudomonadota bacterium]
MGLTALLLLGVEALDELLAGIPTIGAPDVQHEFALSYSALTVVVFVVPQILALVLEPPLFVLADRRPRKWFVCGGVLGMGACAIVAGLAPTVWLFAVALSLGVVASGCGVGLAQATLMDEHPQDRERMMTRWVFLGTLGDVAAPLVFVVAAYVSVGWRAAFLTMGVIIVLYGMALYWWLPRTAVIDPGEHDEQPTIGRAVAEALRNRELVIWLVGCWLCDMMDEILVVFASLRLRNDLGADPAMQGVILSCFMAGALVGLVVVDRILASREPVGVLRICAASCAVCYAGWLFADALWLSAVFLFATGCFCAPLYPIARAQTYRVLPGQSGMVNAMTSLFGPASMALPFVLGALADSAGLFAALCVLLAQPIGLFFIACARAP